MLVLTIEKGKQLLIGDDISVKVVELQHGQVRIGITAPPHVEVDREEVRQAKIRTGNYIPTTTPNRKDSE